MGGEVCVWIEWREGRGGGILYVRSFGKSFGEVVEEVVTGPFYGSGNVLSAGHFLTAFRLVVETRVPFQQQEQIFECLQQFLISLFNHLVHPPADESALGRNLLSGLDLILPLLDIQMFPDDRSHEPFDGIHLRGRLGIHVRFGNRFGLVNLILHILARGDRCHRGSHGFKDIGRCCIELGIWNRPLSGFPSRSPYIVGRQGAYGFLGFLGSEC